MNSFIRILIFVFPFHISLSQNLINQYDPSNHTIENLQSYSSSPSYYWGEFMVFYDDLFFQSLEQFSVEVDLSDYELYYSIECLSIPFQTQAWEDLSENNRWLITPNPSTHLNSVSDVNDLIINSSHKASGASEESRVYNYYYDKLIENNAYSDKSIKESSLITSLFASGSEYSFENLNDARIHLPHSILRIKLHVFCEETEVFQIPFIVDLTRGKMNNYPFCDNFNAASNMAFYDVTIRPKIIFDQTEHSYNQQSNSSFYPANGNGTVNYFSDILPNNFSTDDLSCFPSLVPEDLNVVYQGEHISPPPYSLLDAPILNANHTFFAGYGDNGNDLFPHPTYYTNESSWNYFLDKPIDFTTINPTERIVYLPSEMSIGNPINNIDNVLLDFEGVEVTFPSGYTFKTVLGSYPDKSIINEMIANGECSNWKDCHPPTDVEWSEINIEDGSVLTIESCSYLYDVNINVKPGGTLIYSPDLTYGRYNVNNDGGSIIISTSGNYLFCNSDCLNVEGYDFDDFIVNETIIINNSTSVLGDVIISEGSTLIIEDGALLSMGPDSKVIVKNGGQLICFNSTITSACDQMWRGIEAWNTNDGPAASVFIHNSIIENAHIGVLDGRSRVLGEIETDESNVFSNYINGFETHSWGSQVESINNQFLNCGIGIYHPDFMSYFPDELNLLIEGCEFTTTNGGLIDLEYNSSHPNSYPNITSPWYGKANHQTRGYAGIILGGAKNSTIGGNDPGQGNSFENLEIAIRQSRSNCDVIGNSINNCRYGIYANQSTHYWNSSSRLKLNHNTFTNINNTNFINDNYQVPFVKPNPPFNSLFNSEIHNSACIRLEGINHFEASTNTFGLVSGEVQNGIFTENCSGFFLKGNTFNKNENALTILDSDNFDWGASIVGPESIEDRNLFNDCTNNIITSGNNFNLQIRCNDFNNGNNYNVANWINSGLLGDQGYLPESTQENVTSAAAGNEFYPGNKKQIISFCEDCYYFTWDDASEEVEYSGFTYYHHSVQNEDDEALVPEVYMNSLVSLAPIDAIYDPQTSCEAPSIVNGNNEPIYDFEGLKEEYNITHALLEEKILELDNFNTSTFELLNAIYGGISNEFELKEFLKDHSPLSNTIIKAYMDRLSVPANYYLQVIEENGELTKGLQQLVGVRVKNMPVAIQDQIKQVMVNNPYVESVAEVEQRLDYITKLKNISLLDTLSKCNDLNQFIQLLSTENSNFSKSLLFGNYLINNDSENANAILSQMSFDNSELWMTEALVALSLTNEVDGIYSLDSLTTELLIHLTAEADNSSAFTNSKNYFSQIVEYPIYIPCDLYSVNSKNSVSSAFKPISLSPNPAVDYVIINISGDKHQKLTFMLFDSSGKLSFTKNIKPSNENQFVDLKGLAPGIYNFIVFSDQVESSGKLVIQ